MMQPVDISAGMLGDVIQQPLKIPEYQRPYAWKSKNILALLEDLFDAFRTPHKTYRIGVFILYAQGKTSRDIVDGQQRLVTLTILLYLLRQGKKDGLPLLNEEFPHDESRQNIRRALSTIKEWLSDKRDIDAFTRFIQNHCEMVLLTVDDLSIAFQLFDAQNAKGKPLEPHDLLKAFHLQAINKSYHAPNIQQQQRYVEHWEAAVRDNRMPNLGKHIYRIRRWAHGLPGGTFTIDDVDEFKGIDPLAGKTYPFHEPPKVLDRARYYYPLQINQTILNGARFFEFSLHYIYMEDKLFRSKDAPLKEFYDRHCLYPRYGQSGNTFMRDTFVAAVICYYDRFGDQRLEEAARLLYRWIFYLRLAQSRIHIASIENRVNKKNVFRIILRATHPKMVTSIHLEKMPSHPLTNQEEIIEVFTDHHAKLC